MVFLVAGLATLDWWLTPATWLPVQLPGRIDLSRVEDATSQPWWPWTAGAAGLVLILLGALALAAHLPEPSIGGLSLAGSGAQGRLTVSAKPLAQLAAQELARIPGVRSSSGAMVHRRGQLLARIRVTLEPDAELAAVAAGVDQVAGRLAQVVGRDDLLCQAQLSVARRAGRQPRVR